MEKPQENSYNILKMRKGKRERLIMDMSFMTIFDIIIGILGFYLAFVGIKSYKKGEVDPMIVSAEEMIRCTDIAGLSKALMPKTAIFGGFCVLFAIQGLSNDMGWVEYSQAVNAVFLIAFIIVWVIFSFHIKKAKQTFLH